MKAEDLDSYLAGLGLSVEVFQGGDGQPYTVIRGMTITRGGLTDTICDVAILRPAAEPYVVAPAIHVRPHLISMGTAATQQSPVGPEWQYWSRRYDHPPTPKGIWAHILTVLGEV